jgi:hypothetical protein
MLGAFEFRLDDYVGRCMIVGFVFNSTNNFPDKIQKIYDPDCKEMDLPVFHTALKCLMDERKQNNVTGNPYFGFYRNDITDSDDQHDGVPKPVTLTLRFTAEVQFEEAALNAFLAHGRLDADPPVLELQFSHPHWLTETKCWGFPFELKKSYTEFTPEQGGILVEDDNVCLSFYNDDNDFTPQFSEFQL